VAVQVRHLSFLNDLVAGTSGRTPTLGSPTRCLWACAAVLAWCRNHSARLGVPATFHAGFAQAFTAGCGRPPGQGPNAGDAVFDGLFALQMSVQPLVGGGWDGGLGGCNTSGWRPLCIPMTASMDGFWRINGFKAWIFDASG